VQNRLNVSFADPVSNAEIMLYNNLGQLVLKETINENQSINLENLNTGIYTYNITFDHKSEIGKLIKK
ncbi:MAG TPA: T9SS type A sorting domain-containing protein, partial [Flavobacterium sp.]|uniref:T9SS type A sorting domain-containing protein n=1 Tax=Flavobacterium sp. TaxID=239 RepID=UPI002BC150FD